MATHNEMQATVVGSTRKLLKQRLNECRMVLRKDLKAKFVKPTFDFDKKTLTSDDGTVVLQWAMRQHPDQPESYHNQQTSRGTVKVIENPLAKVA
jgi:hypothetical protein